MSDSSGQPAQKIGADKILLGIVGLAMIIAIFFVSSQRQPALRSSPVGLDGLRVWLTAEGLDAQNFTGGWPILAEEVGLLVVPLYDTELDERSEPPRTQEELILQQVEYDLTSEPIRSKTEMAPTLIVLPKWRTGMRLTRLAHPVLISPRAEVEALGETLVAGEFALSYGRDPFIEIPYREQDALLYAAQTFVAPECRPILGDARAMVLGDCPLANGDDGARIYVLSDPDLVNNHGLALGDNAFLVRDIFKSLSNEGRIIVDYSRRNWLTTDAGQSTRERTWSDLLRFFSPPFTMIWVGIALVFGLVLWRAGLRFGPEAPIPQTGGASKTMAIAARARLMLLTGRAGALVKEYMRARLATAAAQIFGNALAPQFSGPEAFVAYTRRRHPEHAGPLAAKLNEIQDLPAAASSRHAMSKIHDLDKILEHITDDTRGVKRTG